MKKKILLFLTVLCSLAACTEKRPPIIEHPVFEVRNNGSVEIEKIEMTDSATILYFDAFLPKTYWIMISPETYIRESDTEEKLLITGSKGIDLGKQVQMPESGKTSFRLFFPPLKPEVVKIDFIESDCDECFKIWGIHLLPNSKIEVEPLPEKIEQQTLKPLPPPVFSAAKTRVNGKISGYRPEFLLSPQLSSCDWFGQNDKSKTQKLTIAADGTFSGEIASLAPGTVCNSINMRTHLFQMFLLIPGETQEVFIDLKRKQRLEGRYRTDKEPSDSAYIRTSSEYLSTKDIKSILASVRQRVDYQEIFKRIVDMNSDEYKAWTLKQMQESIDKLPAGLSDNGKLLSVCALKLNAIPLLVQYSDFKAHALTQAQEKPVKPEKLADTYYSFLGELMDDYMVYIDEYPQVVSLLTYTFAPSEGKSEPVAKRFARFKERVSPMLGGKDKGILFDLALMQMYAAQIEKAQFYTDTEKQSIQKDFSHASAVADMLITENDKIKELLESKSTGEYVINQTPEVSNEKLFAAILAKYKGKVVVADFWATWCGPCLYGHQLLLPLKTEFKDKDVVFLYLTGETSPLVTWRKMIPTIHGEHYRVSGEQWQYWSKALKIEGVPTYYVFDKEGTQIFYQVGVPKLEDIKKSIAQLL